MIAKERQELYKTIWRVANKLRNSVDGWDFKSYILGFLFYRYISEDFCEFIKKKKENKINFEYECCNDEDEWIKRNKQLLINEKGYFIYPKQLFCNALKDTKHQDNLNKKITKIFRSIEKSANKNKNFKGILSSINLSDEKIGVNKDHRNKNIKTIMNEIKKINFSLKKTKSDVFGDAYEYLIGMYSSRAGKSGGEFYTPPEVSELLAQIAWSNKKEIKSVYDPTCGSGSLLLKFLKANKNKTNLKFYGQEINLTTCNLCKMNMMLRGLRHDEFTIKHGDTLTNNKFFRQKFDAIVSNPPYSIKWDGRDNPSLLKDVRFKEFEVLAPKNHADFAFIQHSLYHLTKGGVAAIICYPGILYRDKCEQQIRKQLVDKNYIDTIVKLPKKLFYGTDTEACITIFKKDSKKDTNILFIDASNEYKKSNEGRNLLGNDNIQKILELYENRENVINYSKLAKLEEVVSKDYNLSVDKYVIKEEIEEEVDIFQLNQSLRETTNKINELREEIEKLIENF